MASPAADAASALTSARTFLERALPQDDADGWLNVHWKTARGMPGESHQSVDAMLAEINRLKSRHDVYVCMSSQAVAGERSKGSARFLKSLFLDVDVKDGAFRSTAEALKAFNAFRGAVRLPHPTLFVMTAGFAGGFHCHWVLNRPLALTGWRSLAMALKNAVKRHGFAIDEGVIADAARVLRIPGATNFKYPHRPPVTLHPSIFERDHSVEEIAGPLAPYLEASAKTTRSEDAGADSPRIRQSALFDGVDLSENDDLTAGLFKFGEFKEAVEFLTRAPGRSGAVAQF